MLSDFLLDLKGTLVLRSYVFFFNFGFFLASFYHMGVKRTFIFMASAFLIAWYCEYTSVNYGVPFGYYTYHLDLEKNRELVIWGIPFFDSLSFVFLSYFSFTTAAYCIDNDAIIGAQNPRTPWLGGLLMMLLDVAIDPITLKGEKFFLGKIYSYPYEGFHFGVTWENYAGWYIVGLLTQFAYQTISNTLMGPIPYRKLRRQFRGLIFGIYTSIFLFIITISACI